MERREPSCRGRKVRPVATRRGHSAQRGHARSPGGGQSTRSRRALPQEIAPDQAGVAQAALRVQDPQLGRPAGRPEPIPSHADLGPLPHHVSPQSNPCSPVQLQPQRGDLYENACQGGGQARRLENEHLDAGAASQRSQSVESLRQVRIRSARPTRGPKLKVQKQQVDSSILQEHRCHRQRFIERVRHQDDQPVELYAPSGGFDRIQAPGKIQIRNYPAGSLGPGHGLQSERCLAAGPISLDSSHRGARQPTQPENPVGIARSDAGRAPGPPGSPSGSKAGLGRGATARAPSTSPPQRGAAPPQRSRRDARAA